MEKMELTLDEMEMVTGGPVIGIAWRADTDSEFFTNVCRAIEAAGGQWVLLGHVMLPDLTYEDGQLVEGIAETGGVDDRAAKYTRCNTWHGSNAAEAVGSVSAVIFTGGEDISPSLYYRPQEAGAGSMPAGG